MHCLPDFVSSLLCSLPFPLKSITTRELRKSLSQMLSLQISCPPLSAGSDPSTPLFSPLLSDFPIFADGRFIFQLRGLKILQFLMIFVSQSPRTPWWLYIQRFAASGLWSWSSWWSTSCVSVGTWIPCLTPSFKKKSPTQMVTYRSAVSKSRAGGADSSDTSGLRMTSLSKDVGS